MSVSIRHEEDGPYVARTVIEWPPLTGVVHVHDRLEDIEAAAEGKGTIVAFDEVASLQDEIERLKAALVDVGEEEGKKKARVSEELRLAMDHIRDGLAEFDQAVKSGKVLKREVEAGLELLINLENTL